MIFASENSGELYYLIAPGQTTSHVTISKLQKSLDFQEADTISTDTRQKKKNKNLVKSGKSQQNQKQ